jgi:hypothetical protein
MAMPSKVERTERWIEEQAPRPRPRPRRRLKPWISIGSVLLVVWAMAVGTSWAGAMVSRAGFQVDSLQTQLTAAERARQGLQDQVVNLTTAQHLSYEANRLGVTLSPVVMSGPLPVRVVQPVAATHRSWWARTEANFVNWLARVKGVQSNIGGGASPARPSSSARHNGT